MIPETAAARTNPTGAFDGAVDADLRRVQNVSFPRSGNSLLTLMLFKYFSRNPDGLPFTEPDPNVRYRPYHYPQSSPMLR